MRTSTTGERWGPGAGPLQGLTVAVTGSSRGLGRELVRQLLAPGRRNVVVAACRDPAAAGLRAAWPAAAAEGRLVVTALDVASERSIAAWVEHELAGVERVDVLVNCAGIYLASSKAFGTVGADDMIATFRTNACGPLLVAQALVNAGKLGGGGPGLVANVSSNLASLAWNGPDERGRDAGARYAYRAAKCALNAVSRSMAVDLAPRRIATVLLHPGHGETRGRRGAGGKGPRTDCGLTKQQSRRT